MLFTPIERAAPARAITLALALLACFPVAPRADTTPPAKVEPPAKSAGTRAVVVESQAMDAIIGKTVKSATGEDLGRLIDVLVDPAGDIRAAVVDFGGVLGVGSRAIAVDWRALDFSESAKNGVIKLTLTRDQVRVAPIYRAGEPVVIMEASKPAEQTRPTEPAKLGAAAPERSSATEAPRASTTTPPAPAGAAPK